MSSTIDGIVRWFYTRWLELRLGYLYVKRTRLEFERRNLMNRRDIP